MIKLLGVQMSLIDNDNVHNTAEVFYEAPYASSIASLFVYGR